MSSFAPERQISSARYYSNPSSSHSPLNNESRSFSSSGTRSGEITKFIPKKNSTFGTMVKKFMEKSSTSSKKPSSSADSSIRNNYSKTHNMVLPVPADVLMLDTNKKKKIANLTKLFQKVGGGLSSSSSNRSTVKALTEVKQNTRTLAMVLRSERELLAQNKEYEQEIKDLHRLVDQKNGEVEKLKDLCLKQREEIKGLKDAILFPDVMNTQLNNLLEKQGSELKQAREMIPSLQKQVSSLTGQLQFLADDLAEVKADKYAAVMTCFDEYIQNSPLLLTPKSDRDRHTHNSLEYSSGCPMTTCNGSADEMFLKDLNPCLTPCFLKTNKSKEHGVMIGYESPTNDRLFRSSMKLDEEDDFSICRRNGILSTNSEQNWQTGSHGNKTDVQKIYKSDESGPSTVKPNHLAFF